MNLQSLLLRFENVVPESISLLAEHCPLLIEILS